MRATFAYTTARIVLFLLAAFLFYLAGARGLLLLGLALVVSGVASYVVLSRQRDAMSGALVSRFRSLRSRFDQGARSEDQDDA
jgi:Mn2+/Fe2+ NRAMP family transporter